MTFFKFFNNSLLVILFIYCPRIITQASQEELHCLICVFCSKSGSRNTAKIYAFHYTFKNKTGQYRKKKKEKKAQSRDLHDNIAVGYPSRPSSS